MTRGGLSASVVQQIAQLCLSSPASPPGAMSLGHAERGIRPQACGWYIHTALVERINLSLRQRVAVLGHRHATPCTGEDACGR